MTTLRTVSTVLGLLYVTAWSVSFYPPLFLNYKLRSTEGISVDFIALNIVGYIALVVSMVLLLFNSDVRQLYFDQHNYYPLLTRIDLAYSVHGFILTLISTSQLFFWGFKKRSIIVRRATKLIILSVFLVCGLLYSIVGTNKLHQLTDSPESGNIYTLLDLAIMLSYVKIGMSVIKYIPQLSHNYKRKSVLGFSIFTIFLDLTGGILSIVQLFVDSYVVTGALSYDVLVNNGGKLGLSFVTLFFDLCFIYQWIIYEKLRTYEHLPLTEKII